jgi:hypothetical protein
MNEKSRVDYPDVVLTASLVQAAPAVALLDARPDAGLVADDGTAAS